MSAKVTNSTSRSESVRTRSAKLINVSSAQKVVSQFVIAAIQDSGSQMTIAVSMQHAKTLDAVSAMKRARKCAIFANPTTSCKVIKHAKALNVILDSTSIR